MENEIFFRSYRTLLFIKMERKLLLKCMEVVIQLKFPLKFIAKDVHGVNTWIQQFCLI